jgi:hypothetical protein
VLADLEGRREDLLYLDPGRVIHPRAVWDVFARLPSIVQYRLVQHTPRTFELEIVTRDPSEGQETMSAAAAGLRELLGDVAIDVKSSQGPLTGPGGKARPVVSLCAPPQLRQRNGG